MDIETSPHSQPGACIKTLQQVTRGNVSAVFENLILLRQIFCDIARGLRHVEKLINHQPAVTALCVMDCSVKKAYVSDKEEPLFHCLRAVISLRELPAVYVCLCVTLHKHGLTQQQGGAVVATSLQMAVILLTSVSC